MATYLISIPVLFVLGIIVFELYKYLNAPQQAYHPNIVDINTTGFFTVVKSFTLGALGMTLLIIFG